MVPERDRVAVRAGGGWDARYQALDAWRGLACLLVVVHHAGYALAWAEARDSWWRWLTVLAVRRMDLGVSLFFVISGYCIAASADGAVRKGDPPSAFLSRRVWRIYPPYWFALLGFVAVVAWLDAAGLARFYRNELAVMLDPPRDLDWRHWLGNLTLTETWRPHVYGPDRNVFTGVAWSLCFEEQFYLICFLAIWLAPGRLFRALGCATAALAAVRAYAWGVGGLDGLSGTFPLLWHEFAVGLAVYYRLRRAETDWEKRLVEFGLFALCVAGLSTRGRATATAAAFGLALIALRPWDGWWATAPVLAPFRACGRRCYSIYLAHLPASVIGNQWLYELGYTSFWARVLVMIPVVSAAGLATGWAFHAAIESRFLVPPPALGRWLVLRPRPRRRAALAGASTAAN
jgi:peptidoglycan/LPS O-acetylase OafA/YrhL